MTDVPLSSLLLKIIAIEATNKVSSIKIPNVQCTKTMGREKTRNALFIDNFPDSRLIYDTNDE
jgi:hypothetical protein